MAENWIDAADKRISNQTADLNYWWHAFKDPVLNALIIDAYQQNLSLREAGYRVLQARAKLGIAIGNYFPQSQDMAGNYVRRALSKEVANRQFIAERFYNQWDYGFGLAWELDFWGRFRRAVEADDAELNASVEEYDDVLVTLLGDVAFNYVLLRTLEAQIALAQANVQLQNQTLSIARARFKGGEVNELDVDQAESTLAQTQALIPALEIQRRHVNNRLCILLGIPPEDLAGKLGRGDIPKAPAEVAVGIPADLLRRRPDVRRAESKAAAQSARIGVAEADFYPAISITGNIGYSSEQLQNLLTSNALAGAVGPSFDWKILNYGRIANNVLLQTDRFQELAANYQNTVLKAGEEVENGLVVFLQSQHQVRYLQASVEAALKAVKVAVAQYKAGMINFNRVSLLQQNLVVQQDALAQGRGEIALGLILVYKALGGGWQIRHDISADPGCGSVPVESSDGDEGRIPFPPTPLEESMP